MTKSAGVILNTQINETNLYYSPTDSRSSTAQSSLTMALFSSFHDVAFHSFYLILVPLPPEHVTTTNNQYVTDLNKVL